MSTQTPTLDGSRHPFDFHHRPGMELRPAPPRIRPSAEWTELRRRLLSSWIDVQSMPVITPQIQLLNDHFWEGDRLMDPVVEMFQRAGSGAGRAMFTQALDHGIESVDEAPPELVALFAQVDRVPDWFDAGSFERGRIALVNGTLFGKFAAFTVNNVITALGEAVSAATGSSGRLVRDPLRRQFETSDFFMRVSKPDTADRYSAGFRNLLLVRLMHAQARRGMRTSWGPEGYAHHGSPISNTDMAFGIPMFGIMQPMYDARLGARLQPRTFDDINMFWGYLAFVMGIAEEIIPRSAQDAVRQMDYMFATLGPGTQWSEELADALLRYPLEVMVAAVESPTLRRLTRAIGVPLLCGYTQYICGKPLAPAMMKSLAPAQRLDRLQHLAAGVAHVSVRASQLADRRPGAEARARGRASDGDPFQNLMSGLIARASAKADQSGWTFISHDESTGSNFDRLVSR